MNVAPPTISIITIVRNDADGLTRTRASVAAQLCRDFEWIVIDGASTDATVPLVRTLLESGEAKGVSERDRGIYDAMNKGLDQARGSYVLFLNAGDRLLGDDALTNALAALQAAGSPQIGFFASQMDFGDRIIDRPVKQPDYVWHGQPGLHQATFFDRELHLQHRFGDAYKVCGDYDALTRMAVTGATMRSFSQTIGVNSFESGATSGRFKLRLIREAATIQHTVLRLPPWRIAVSVTHRAAASLAFKALTTLDAIRQR